MLKKEGNQKLGQTDEGLHQKTALLKPTEKMIYIGPTITGVVSENAVYCNGLPVELEEKVKTSPLIKNLIVPINKLAHAKADLKKENSALQICYQKVKKKEGE